MKERAYAKINLALDVCGTRADGYHELNSIMLPVNFYDVLEINISDKDSYECNWHYIKYNEHNSIYKMIALLKERYDISDHHSISLDKSIPIQAGLGGGTADAAAALRIFEKMYNLELSKEEIRDICVKVGADVLFNYYNKPAQVKGLGDIVEPIYIKNVYYVLLVKPKTGVSTVEAFRKLDMDDCDHPDIERLKVILENGESLRGMLGNSLQSAAISLNPDIQKAIDRLSAAGGENVLMSGSGSTVFAISNNRKDIMKLHERFKYSQYYVRFGKIMSK